MRATDPKLALRMTKLLVVILSASFGSIADFWVINRTINL